MPNTLDADYVVVGAGSAGCVVASRLAEAGASVVLLEAGPPDRHPMIHIPAGIKALLQNPSVNWNYSSEPEPGTDGRRIHWPRGRVLGGSSSINGMLYVRGNPQDFDTWAQMGCRGWSYDEVLPLFRKSERYNGGGDPDYRGTDGVLAVEDYRTILPVTHHFVDAAKSAGHAFREDLNGVEQEGVGYSQMTRLGRRRHSTAQSFLASARKHSNLTVQPNAQATGLVMDGTRCTGVKFVSNGKAWTARAAREVIVSGGAVNSPHLLQISGIGPQAHLRDIKVDVHHDLPGVGGNLQDHYVVRVAHRLKGLQTINELSRFPQVVPHIFRWIFKGDGALTFGVTSAQVFCRSREGLASPDLQLLFTPASYDQSKFGQFEREPGASIAVCPVRPASRGTIMAASADPLAAPRITPNYLSDPDDYRVLLAGIEQARDIFAQESLGKHSGGELTPGSGVTSADDLKAFARKLGGTLYHPVGTCKMGIDPQAVVDERLRVHGLQGLRVVDASVMPVLTTGNTNAPTIMIGEKAAVMLGEDAR
jgi:choline dehydrogenase